MKAQRVYLTICLLNRLEVPVRAGIISRIHDIPFGDFKARLFKPLEHVVYDTFDARMRDNVYPCAASNYRGDRFRNAFFRIKTNDFRNTIKA